MPMCNNVAFLLFFLLTGNVQNVNALNCSVIVWDAPEDEHCCGHELTYKVRLYSGISFDTSSASQRTVFWTPNKWVTFSAADIPTGRPLYAIVSVRLFQSPISAWSCHLLKNYYYTSNYNNSYVFNSDLENVAFRIIFSSFQVKARNNDGTHSADWTDPVLVTGKPCHT